MIYFKLIKNDHKRFYERIGDVWRLSFIKEKPKKKCSSEKAMFILTQ